MELGGFDVEVGTGEGQEYPSNWWEEAGTGVEEETGSEQEYEEEMPEQEHSGDILTGEGVIEEVAPENLYSGMEENNQSVPEQENDSENQSHSESQSSNMEENRTDIITKGQIPVPSLLEENTVIKTQTPTTIPDVSETPTPSIALSPSLAPIQTSDFSSAFIQEASGPFPIFQDFSVFFHHLPVPQNQRMPYVEIQSEGQVGIVSVRHNHQECRWWREGNRLFWEMESSEGENTIEILVITEDCRLVMMEPWIYSEEG